MPACVFRKCTNYHRKVNKDNGISYHRFPSDDEVILQHWIAVVRKQRCEYDWMPSNSSRICSNHFKNEDKYTSKKGLTLLKKNAVPVLQPRVAAKRSLAELAQVNISFEDGTSGAEDRIHEDNKGHGEISNITGLHEGVQCNECLGDIIGFRYICMQCADWELCGACEARAAHAHHLVLRVPKPHTYSESQRMIDSIRSSIGSFLQPQVKEVRESFEIEVKQEADSDDDDIDNDNYDDGQLKPEPEFNMYPEAKPRTAMLKMNKERQILVNVQNMEFVLDPLSSSEERAVPKTSLGHDKPKIKLKRDQSSSLIANSSHSSSSKSDQHEDTSIIIKEEPITIVYEPLTCSGQNEDELISDETYDKGNTKRKKYC